MSILARAQSGVQKQPDFILVYGISKIGKSTFAAEFPAPIFADIEKGTGQLDVTRIDDFKSFKDLIALVDELIAKPGDRKTFVIDSLDHAEILLWSDICKAGGKASISDFPYGNGYVLALNEWKILIEKLETLRQKMNVVLISHSQVKSVNDPTLALPYDKHLLKLHAKASDLIRESVDAILFANFPVYLTPGEGREKTKAVADGKPKLFCLWSPAYEAGNRYGLPAELDLSYEAYRAAREANDPSNAASLHERLKRYIPQIKNETARTKAEAAYKKAGDNTVELSRIDRRVREIVETAMN